jgi:YfiH family protein
MSVLHSALLTDHGFAHAFATRTGGVSTAPFDTLNLGFHLGDDDDAVRENRARFLETLAIGANRFYEQHQVHGTHVREILANDDADAIAHQEGDALMARVEGAAVCARMADCVPVLVAHPATGQVGAAHAGWRGAVAGVVPRLLEVLAHDPADLIVAIGPHIRVGAFEIGEDVAAEMEATAPGTPVVLRADGRLFGDLSALVRHQLRDAGVPHASIDDVGGCTFADAAKFFSHRRDHGRTGRHLSAIVARAPR